MSNLMHGEVNPYAAPATEELADLSGPVISGSRRGRWALVLSCVLLVGSIVAAACAVYDIESIMGSGPAILVVSVVLMLLARADGLRSLQLIGAALITTVLGCFFTIWSQSWSPSDAQKPVGWAVTVVALLMQSNWLVVASIRKHLKSVSESLPLPESSMQQEPSVIGPETD